MVEQEATYGGTVDQSSRYDGGYVIEVTLEDSGYDQEARRL
jgi:hypothetical protein